LVRTVNRDADGRRHRHRCEPCHGGEAEPDVPARCREPDTRITNGIDGALSQTYGYDPLSRLTSAASTARSSTFGHDANANRIAHTEGGANLPLVVAADSNRLMESGAWWHFHDAAGNRVVDDDGWDYNEYQYDAFQRMKRVDVWKGYSATLTHMKTNGLDQRVYKTSVLGTKRFVYLGQNQLLAEQGSAGWKRYVWLGDTLVGVVTPQNAVHYVHTDHLGRPEATTNTARAYTWRAANHAFDRTVTLDQIGWALRMGFPGLVTTTQRDWTLQSTVFAMTTGSGVRIRRLTRLGSKAGLNPYVYAGANPICTISQSVRLVVVMRRRRQECNHRARRGPSRGTAATGMCIQHALIGMGHHRCGARVYFGGYGV
jgi:hypothetical protein